MRSRAGKRKLSSRKSGTSGVGLVFDSFYYIDLINVISVYSYSYLQCMQIKQFLQGCEVTSNKLLKYLLKGGEVGGVLTAENVN